MKNDRTSDTKFAKGRLSASWRTFAHRMALGFTIMTSACAPKTTPAETDNKPRVEEVSEANAKTNPPKADPPEPERVELDAEVILSDKEQAKHDKIGATLLKQAQKEFLQLAGLSSAEGYSQQLAQLQSSLNARLLADTSVHNRIVILDPEKFEIGIALGLAPADAVSKMLAEAQVKPDKNMLKGLTSKIGTMTDDRYAGETFTQDPTALTNLTRLDAVACVIVPSSEHALVVDIKGLSPQEQVNLADRHEGWHCLDSKYTLRGIDTKKLDHLPKGGIAQNVGNKTVLEVFANGYRKEAFADLGAIGDMIRHEGYGLDLAVKISDWRKAHPNDTQHLSAPVIDGFKKHIEQMGLENFRKLDDEQAKAIYFEMTDTFGMSARSLEINLRLEKMNMAGRLAYLDANRADPEMQKALDFIPYYFNKPTDKPAPLTEDEKKMSQELRHWRAGDLLQDKAFELSKKITPATLVLAYEQLQDGLHADRLAHPADPMLAAKMTKLQQSFVYEVTALDYVLANQNRGVDITKIEPALQAPKAVQKGAHTL